MTTTVLLNSNIDSCKGVSYNAFDGITVYNDDGDVVLSIAGGTKQAIHLAVYQVLYGAGQVWAPMFADRVTNILAEAGAPGFDMSMYIKQVTA